MGERGTYSWFYEDGKGMKFYAGTLEFQPAWKKRKRLFVFAVLIPTPALSRISPRFSQTSVSKFHIRYWNGRAEV